MKYKIEPGCDLFDKLCEMREYGRQCNRAASDFAKKHGSDQWAFPHSSVWGGVAGLVFREKPSGWKPLSAGIFAPNKANKEVLAEMEAVPMVSLAQFNAVLGYKPESGSIGKRYVRSYRPAIFFGDRFILVETSEVAKNYVPVDGMVEILESEYNSLMEEIDSLKIPANEQ